MRIYPRDNTTIIEVPALKDDADSLVTTATVEATITLEDGASVPGVTNPIAMVHKGSGRYEGSLPPITLENETRIIIKVLAKVSGVIGTVREVFVVRDRGFYGVY